MEQKDRTEPAEENAIDKIIKEFLPPERLHSIETVTEKEAEKTEKEAEKKTEKEAEKETKTGQEIKNEAEKINKEDEMKKLLPVALLPAGAETKAESSENPKNQKEPDGSTVSENPKNSEAPENSEAPKDSNSSKSSDKANIPVKQPQPPEVRRRHLLLNGLTVCVQLPVYILALVYHGAKLLTCTGIFPDSGTGLSYNDFPALKTVNLAATGILFLLIVWCASCIFELSAREKCAPGRYLGFMAVSGIAAPLFYLIQIQVITGIPVAALFRKEFLLELGVKLLYLILMGLYYRLNRKQFAG